MTKIRCILPNASEEMNGIKFAVDAGGGVVSVDAVPDDLAAIFLSVPGFTAEGGKPEDDPEEVARQAAEAKRIKDEKTALAKVEKKATDAAGKPPKLTAKEKAAIAAAEKAAEGGTDTPPVDPATTGTESTGTESTQAADENGKQEGEE